MNPAPRPISGPPRSCSGCGRVGASSSGRADLGTVWLLPGAEGPLLRRFCRRCVPGGPVGEVACVYCGDGPLLAGAFAVTGVPDPAVGRWLVAEGWALGPALTCPSCRRAFGRESSW